VAALTGSPLVASGPKPPRAVETFTRLPPDRPSPRAGAAAPPCPLSQPLRLASTLPPGSDPPPGPGGGRGTPFARPHRDRPPIPPG
jgi:hypothetical protein